MRVSVDMGFVEGQIPVMASAFASITDRYQGAAGRDYHSIVHGGADAAHDAIAESRARKLQPLIKSTDRVLEFGAGTLYNLAALRCAERVAYDISDAGAEQAARLGIRFTTAVEALASDFDVVICHHMLEHVAEPLAVLEGVADRLRPGGKLLLYVPLEHARQQYDPLDHHQHLYSWTPATLGNLVATTELVVERAAVGEFGYERRLAWMHRLSPAIYRAALYVARFIRPAREIRLVARKVSAFER